MIELLNLCGFGAQDIKSELPRIEKTFSKLGITSKDIERGKQRLNKYYDIDLKSVRKALRICLLALVDSVLAREEGKKVLFGYMSGPFALISGALVSKSKEVYSAPIDFLFPLVLGGIFDKQVPVLEAAEKKWLKAGAVAHCANLKSIVGLFALDLLPRPDLLVTTGYLCEAAPKTLDLLHEFYDIPVCCADTCTDRAFRENLGPKNRVVDFAVESLRRLIERVQEIVGFEITARMLRETINGRGEFFATKRKVDELIEGGDPLPIRPATELIWTTVGALSLSLSNDRLPELIDAVNTEYEELKERVDKGEGVVVKGAPRIISLLPMHQADPRMEHLITELGIALVPSAVSGPPPGSVIEGEIDPIIETSLGIGSVEAVQPSGRISWITKEVKRLKIDGVLDRFHTGCRIMVGDAILIKEAIEKEAGIPVLLMEWENFDPRVYNHEEFKRRLEVFKAMMANKSA